MAGASGSNGSAARKRIVDSRISSLPSGPDGFAASGVVRSGSSNGRTWVTQTVKIRSRASAAVSAGSRRPVSPDGVTSGNRSSGPSSARLGSVSTAAMMSSSLDWFCGSPATISTNPSSRASRRSVSQRGIGGRSKVRSTSQASRTREATELCALLPHGVPGSGTRASRQLA